MSDALKDTFEAHDMAEIPTATCHDCRWQMSTAAGCVEYVAEHAAEHAVKKGHDVLLYVKITKGLTRVDYYAWTFSRDAERCGEGIAAFKEGQQETIRMMVAAHG